MPADFKNYTPKTFCFDIRNIGPNGASDEGSDTAIAKSGHPVIPSWSSERELGRWHMYEGSRPSGSLFVRKDADGLGPNNPSHGLIEQSLLYTGDFKCLVSDRALRFVGTAGEVSDFGTIGRNAVLAFTLPYDQVTEVGRGRSTAVTTSSATTIYCEAWDLLLTMIHATPANAEFDSGIFALSKLKRFVDQVAEARARANRTHGISS